MRTPIQYLLKEDEYYTEVKKKDTIYIHHTAGGHRPDWTIDGWERDTSKQNKINKVGTAFVIGGLSTTTGESSYDGLVYQAFDERLWCNHLGLRQFNNRILNQTSIAIELCSYGPLTRTRTGEYISYINKPVPIEQVGVLVTPFRGYQYYHKYTEKQLIALKELLLHLAVKYKINLKSGMQQVLLEGGNPCEINTEALRGIPGLYTHSNVRKDKTDCWPQPELLTMIRSL